MACLGRVSKESSPKLLPLTFAFRMLISMVSPLIKLRLRMMPKRRWAQFSLGTMFVLVTVLCLALGLWVVPAERQRRAVAAIEDIGGWAVYAKAEPTEGESFAKALVRRWLPIDYFDHVQAVDLSRTALTDAELANLQAHLEALTGLERLSLFNTRVTDAGLACLCSLSKLRELDLGLTQVRGNGLRHLQGLARLEVLTNPVDTDAGLAYLCKLTGLKVLHLAHARVTPAGLANLRPLVNLQTLSLWNATVTDEGLAHLQELRRLEELELSGTQIEGRGLIYLRKMNQLRKLSLGGTPLTDAGLAYMPRMTGLQQLHIWQTQVTDTGLSRLRKLKGLEWLHLGDTYITDAGLAHLSGMTGLQSVSLNGTQISDKGIPRLCKLKKLQWLYLDETSVTKAGVARLQRTLPKCVISAQRLGQK